MEESNKCDTFSTGLGDALSVQELDKQEDTRAMLFYRLAKEMKQNALHMLGYHV